jgi:aquaporin Z
VTLGVWAGGKFNTADIVPYWIAQVAGAIIAAALLYYIASGKPGWLEAQNFASAGAFATNGYGALSPTGYSLAACFVTEAVLTFIFLTIILGSTSARAPAGFAPIAIGLGLTLIHLIGIPVTNLSVNPARSTGPAIVVGGWALGQLWLFWAAPIAGAVAAGLAYPMLAGDTAEKAAPPAKPAREEEPEEEEEEEAPKPAAKVSKLQKGGGGKRR